MAERRYAVVFLDNDNCEAWWVLHGRPGTPRDDRSLEAGYRSGFTERNIGELVELIIGQGYHVTLYRVGKASFHAAEGA